MQHNFLTRLLLTLTLLVGFSPSVWADEHNEAARYAGFEALPAAQEGDVVFIGNSITHMMNWWEAFGNKHNVHGRGNSGAKTYQALANLESMIAGQPSKAFVMLGTNDFGNGDNPQHVALLVKTLCKRIRLESPRTTVYLQSILPSNNGAGRNQANMTTANNLLKQWVEEQHDANLVYVDLYSLLDDGTGSIKNRGNKGESTLSYDDLHLTPIGYRIWMEHIKSLSGLTTVIPEGVKNLHGNQTTSWGARIATFGTMPVKSTDILLFGDDFIHYGEWHEMLGSTDFKDRGTGWQFFSSDLGCVKASLDPALSKTQYNVTTCGVVRETPRAIGICAGGRNIMNGQTDAQVQSAFNEVVTEARRLVGNNTPIFLMSVLPLDNATKNAQVVALNNYMKQLAQNDAHTYYVDLYGNMTDTSGNRIADYFHANRPVKINNVTINPYPTPLGYVKAANVLADAVNTAFGSTVARSAGYQAISLDDAQKNIDRFAARTIVGTAVNDAVSKLLCVGTAPGQYSAASVATAEATIANACKVLYNGTTLTQDAARSAIAPLSNLGLEVVMPNVSDERSQYYYTISDARSSKFITAASGTTALTSNATASGAADQQWKLTRNADGSYNIQNVLTGGYLNMTSDITTSDAVPAQGWTLAPVGDGYFTIVSGTNQINVNGSTARVYNWGDGNSGGKEDPGCYFRFVLAAENVAPVVVEPVLPYGEGSGLNNLMPRPQKVTLGTGVYTGAIADAKVEKITAAALTALGAYDYEVAGFDNEGYQLIITTSGITIKAATDLGVIRAKQTLAQMEQGGTFECCEIVDWPAFKVRGLMHDVGRSFISYEEIKKEIDLLARFKVNMFHWHLTDNHGFRFESLKYPDLNTKGFSRFPGKIYTQAQCRELDQYARDRGVIIIPEIDMPGHSASFETAMGCKMSSTQGKTILKGVLDEVISCFPNAPYIHIGGDETAEATIDYINEMADYVHAKNKKTVLWNTYGPAQQKLVDPNTMHVDMITNWATSGRKVNGVPNIDMRYFYVNHFDVFADLEGAYRSLILEADRGDANIGGISIGIWNDRLLGDEKQIIAQNNVYATALAITERAWCGGTYKGNRHQYIEQGRAYLPNDGWEYEEFADWERRFLIYKNSWLKDEPIPYVKQTNIRWNITKGYANDGDKTRSFAPETATELTVEPGSTFATGAGVWLNHIWAGQINGVFPSKQNQGQTRYAWTYVYSPKAQEVGAQIEFYNYSRSDGGRVPQNGSWDLMGSRVWVNNSEILPDFNWTNAGGNPGQDQELGNLNFPGRKPVKVQLQQGWNKVLLKLPYVNASQGRGNKWQYTFVFTDTDGKNAVDGLVYSPSKSTNGTEDFTVPAVPRVEPTVSTTGDTHWYTIKSLRGSYNVKSAGLGANMTREAAASEAAYWKFERRSDNSYNIINYSDGGYLSPVPNGSNLQCVKAEPANGWTLDNAAADGYFIVKCDANHAQLHNDKNGNVLNWGYGSQTPNEYRADDDGCEFIFTEIEGLTAPNTPDAPAAQRYTIRLVDTDFYFTTNEVSDNSNKTYSISTEPEVFIVNKVDGGYTIVSENGKQVGVNSNGWDFANSAYTWNIENIEEPTRILMNGQQKGFGVNDKANNAPAFTDKHSGNAQNGYGASCYTWIFEAVDAPATEVYYTITNRQKGGNTYALLVENGVLTHAAANVDAKTLGDAALFSKEVHGEKWAFKNKETGQYLIWRGNSGGYNSNKGVLDTFNETYCDLTPKSSSNCPGGYYFVGKRNNGTTDGSWVIKTNGDWDAYSGDEGWSDSYSNIFLLEEVSVAVPTIDYIIDKDHGNLYRDNTPNQNWNGTWKSSQQPELQFVAYDNRKAVTNNMAWEGTTLRIESGQLPPCTYTITAPEGYVVDSYSFDFTAKTATSNTLTVGGTEYATSQTAKHAEVTGVNDQTASFTLAGQNNTGTLLTNFVVKLRKLGAEEPEPDVLFTTEDEAAANDYRWVRISNVREAYSIYANGDEALHSERTDFTNEGELFALVGTADNFKLYSRKAKAHFGYSANAGGSPVTTGGTTQAFKLVNNTTNSQPGLNIVPTSNEAQSFNMHGGSGKDIKFFNSTNENSTWKITLVNKEEKGGISLNGEPTSDLNKLIGKLNVTVGTTSSETLVTTENVKGDVTYYVNERDRLSVSAGYTFRGYKAPTVNGMNVTYTVDEDNKAQYLFYSTGAAHPYRIPSISRTPSGRLIALSDYRTCGADIGYGRVDIVGRYSDDNGQTWSNEYMVLEGDGDNNSNTCGYGDAALVTDWETGEVMLMCVSAPNGGTCWTARQRGVVSVSSDNGLTWSKPVDIKDKICNTSTSLLPGVRNYFVGSGKLHQSRYIKVGTHYRVYAALWTTPDGSSCDNHVIYTDDFGQTWKLLGTTTTCVDGGNEPKCEELPDGSVLISSRKGYGRYYNVFTYDTTDNADYSKGSWGQRVEGCNSGDSSTNGEILITKAVRKSDGKLVTIALQSMPNSGRNNVTIWYKELSEDPTHKFTSSEFAGAWTVGKQVSSTSSAYSTMCMQNDGRIAFFFEEGPAGYEMVYMPLTISEATSGNYGPDFWTIGHAAKAVKMTEDGNCTLREILDIERYLLNPAK